MWKVILKSEAEEELRLGIKKGDFSKEDVMILKAWTAFVEHYGPVEL